MSIANSSAKHPAQVAELQAGRRPEVVVAVVAGAAAAASAVKKVVRGSPDEEILRRMRARPNLLTQHRPSSLEADHVERIGGDAPSRA